MTQYEAFLAPLRSSYHWLIIMVLGSITPGLCLELTSGRSGRGETSRSLTEVVQVPGIITKLLARKTLWAQHSSQRRTTLANHVLLLRSGRDSTECYPDVKKFDQTLVSKTRAPLGCQQACFNLTDSRRRKGECEHYFIARLPQASSCKMPYWWAWQDGTTGCYCGCLRDFARELWRLQGVPLGIMSYLQGHFTQALTTN